ncbi:hypothetical protein Dsin_017427 [Dipteronia sinensis]|uniref:Reverse transcriptase zinc-binding domain-containing protein n=1 Tax=Dipteronia sinensis TaxID=43782 RepID=A0AAE0E6E7_9ROSI|nr:hypothetical protein Dsin_017427 [Dipteronia sinensis]
MDFIKKKIHWCSLAKLCDSKDCGGMGFRDLSLFNQAMLAKQSWRLAEHCAAGLYVWQSLPWGRELLEAGSRWRIGTRSSVSIYTDKWIPRPHSFMTQSQPVLGIDAIVRYLISPSGTWNVPLIRASFPPDEAEVILSLPFGSTQTEDVLLWHYDNGGIYTVKCGYKLGKLIQSQYRAFSSSDCNWWKALWNLRILAKIRCFIWKACHHWIPTLVNLVDKGISTDVLCPVGSQRPETTIQTLWNCLVLNVCA